MDVSFEELNQKINLLSTQVGYLTEQAQIVERDRRARIELMQDLTPIANEGVNLAITQLEEIQEYIDLSDLLRIAKRFARSGRNFEKILDQLESMVDLVQMAGPIADEAFGKAVGVMADLEEKGYFTVASGSVHIMDNVVGSLREEDFDQLGAAIVLILDTLKDLAQSEKVNFLQNTILTVEKEVDQLGEISIGNLLGQMRDPAVRRGLAMVLIVLRSIGMQSLK